MQGSEPRGRAYTCCGPLYKIPVVWKPDLLVRLVVNNIDRHGLEREFIQVLVAILFDHTYGMNTEL